VEVFTFVFSFSFCYFVKVSIPDLFSVSISLFDKEIWLQILAKAEFLNPGGSVKDRVAEKIIQEVTLTLNSELTIALSHYYVKS
jgi:cysteine synthase